MITKPRSSNKRNLTARSNVNKKPNRLRTDQALALQEVAIHEQIERERKRREKLEKRAQVAAKQAKVASEFRD